MYNSTTNNLIIKSMQSFDKYPLKPYSRNHIEAYLRYRSSEQWSGLDLMHPHFMLIDDNGSGDEFLMSMLNALKIISCGNPFGMYHLSEQELLNDPSIFSTLDRNNILVIRNCPFVSMDEATIKKWYKISQYAELASCPTMVLLVSSETALVRFKPDEHLFYRVFNNHIEFKPQFDEDDILRLMDLFIDDTLNWKRTEDFDKEIAEYIHHVYPKAQLKNQAFINDLNKRILEAYFHKDVQDEILTGECIPYYIHDNTPIQDKDTGLCISTYSQHENKKCSVKNVLILALSTFPFNGQLQSTNLIYQDGKSAGEYFYQLEPIPRMLIDTLNEKNEKLDKIIMLCTGNVYTPIETKQITDSKQITITNSEGGLISPIDYFVWSVKNYASIKGYDKTDIIFRDFGPSADNSMNIDKIISDILNEIRSSFNNNQNSQTNIFVDAHGGLRTTQELLNSVLSLMRIEGLPIKYDNIFSVEYDNKNNIGKIIPAGEVIHIMDFVSGINECINYGRADSLTRFYSTERSGNIDSEIIGYITDAAQGIQLCNMEKFETALDKLSLAFDAYKTDGLPGSYLSSFLPLIKSNYQNLLSPERSIIDEIDWCTQKGFYQQALTLIESKMPEVIIKNGLLQGQCFTHRNFITIIRDSLTELIKKAKTPWQSDYNFLFHQYGFLCVKDDENKNKKYLPISAEINYKNIEYYKKWENLTIKPKKGNEQEETTIDIFERTLDNKKLPINQMIQLHMALKNERNNINHASASDMCYNINDIQHALKSYVELARELGLKKV